MVPKERCRVCEIKGEMGRFWRVRDGMKGLEGVRNEVESLRELSQPSTSPGIFPLESMILFF